MSAEQRVRRAAVELFASKGFHGTGIRDLAQSAGLSSATLYHYMGSKDDLLVAVMTDSLRRLVHAAERCVASADRPADQLAALVRMHVREHAERRAETTVADGEIRALTGERRAEVVALRDRYERLWQDVIDAGCRGGDLASDAPDETRRALLDMCSGVSRWYSPTGRLALDDLADRYVVLALGMLGAAR